MDNNDYFYDIIYRLKWEKETKEIIWIKYKILDLYMVQLKKQAVSFHWDMVFWIQNLEFFEIYKKNYEYIEDWKYIIHIEDIKGQSIKADLHSISTWHENEDITNKILFDYWITWKDYYKKWKVILEYNSPKDSILYVDSHEFKLEEWSKWLEFFRLIFIAKKLYQTNKFIYSKLKKVYNDCWIKFEKLESTDLSQIGINSFLWKKIKTIQDKTKMKEKCLDITSAFISIRQEKATKN